MKTLNNSKMPVFNDLLKFVYNELSIDQIDKISNLINENNDLGQTVDDIKLVKNDFEFESSQEHLDWLQQKKDRMSKSMVEKADDLMKNNQLKDELLILAENIVKREAMNHSKKSEKPVAYSTESIDSSKDALEKKIKSLSIEGLVKLIQNANNELLIKLIENEILLYLRSNFKHLAELRSTQESEVIFEGVVDKIMTNSVSLSLEKDLYAKIESLIVDFT